MSRTLGATLLVAGASVGATSFALPFSLAALGFPLSCLLILLICGLTIYSALLTLEVNLWFPRGTHFITMAQRSIGRSAAVIMWIFYAFFFYAFISAYLSGGSALLSAALFNKASVNSPNWLTQLPWLIIYAAVLYFRDWLIDWFNRILFAIILVCLAALLYLAIPHMQMHLLLSSDSTHFLKPSAVIFTAFCFQYLIPSLRIYLNSNFSILKRALIIGTLLAGAIYLIWIFTLFAVVPSAGDFGFHQLGQGTHPVFQLIYVMKNVLQSSLLIFIFTVLGVAVIATTFVSISISMFDYFADSFNIVKNNKGKMLLLALVFIPPYIYNLFFPNNFIQSLTLTGALSIVLYYLMPIVMVWYGRYVKQLSFGQRIGGGKISLGIAAIFLFALVYWQLHLLF